MPTCTDCGAATSLWRGMLSSRCSACQARADADRQRTEEEAQARQAAAAERLRAEQDRLRREGEAARRKCPSCGGTRFRRGWLPDSGGSMLTGSNCIRFRPDENLISSYQLYALACLNCGQVRLFLHEGDQTDLAGGV